jgi:hypothetical protein
VHHQDRFQMRRRPQTHAVFDGDIEFAKKPDLPIGKAWRLIQPAKGDGTRCAHRRAA